MTHPSLQIEGELTIYSAAAQRAALLPWLEAAAEELDLSQVTECDTAGVQLLLSTKLTLDSRGRSLRLVAPSGAVRDALTAFGLDEQLLPRHPLTTLTTDASTS